MILGGENFFGKLFSTRKIVSSCKTLSKPEMQEELLWDILRDFMAKVHTTQQISVSTGSTTPSSTIIRCTWLNICTQKYSGSREASYRSFFFDHVYISSINLHSFTMSEKGNSMASSSLRKLTESMFRYVSSAANNHKTMNTWKKSHTITYINILLSL